MPTATPDLSTKLNDSLGQIETILSAFFAQTDAMTILVDADDLGASNFITTQTVD